MSLKGEVAKGMKNAYAGMMPKQTVKMPMMKPMAGMPGASSLSGVRKKKKLSKRMLA